MTDNNRQQGFTLIEIILTIVLAALAGLASFVFLGGVVTRSADPVIMVQNLAASQTGMEKATEEYQDYLTDEDITWEAFQEALLVIPGISFSPVSLNGETFALIEVTATSGQQTVRTIFAEKP